MTSRADLSPVSIDLPRRMRSAGALPLTGLRRHISLVALLLPVLLGSAEVSRQVAEARYVASVAQSAIRSAGAVTPRQQVLALRDYLRVHVSYYHAPYRDRPFLRATAGETLRSGEGYCGEVTRAFICMASAVGIPAERINLYGSRTHVVAEAALCPHQHVLVDCQNPPQIAGLETLDQVILRPEYDDYGTVNLRRLHIAWLVTRLKLGIGPLTFWSENPHALKALMWYLIPPILISMTGARRVVRLALYRRGWIHVTDRPAVERAAVALAPAQGADRRS
jgi:hypothetical protein